MNTFKIPTHYKPITITHYYVVEIIKPSDFSAPIIIIKNLIDSPTQTTLNFHEAMITQAFYQRHFPNGIFILQSIEVPA